jgi:serine/threonine-protein kinase
MAEAHALGIVHRDLKSSNLFVTRRPDGSERLKVLDFGIAKVTHTVAEDSRVTRTLAVMGSPTYMSPEQLKSARNVDERTDVWALGVILYELLTARVPFDGDDLLELYSKISSGDVPALGRADLPEGLAAVVSRCLEKAREDRYANVAELALALAPFGPKHAMETAARVLKITQAAKPMSTTMDIPMLPSHKVKAAAFAAVIAFATFGVLRSCGDTSARVEASPAPVVSPR